VEPGNSARTEAQLPGFSYSAMTEQRKTYDRALNMLAFRARTVSELRRQLIRKGEPAPDVDAAIQRLLEQGLLNDAAFARQFARTKLTGTGASKLRIVQELSRKGVSRDVADAALAELKEDDGLDPSATIHRVAEKKWRALTKLDDVTARRRLYAFLARRGFNPDEIRGAMSTLGADLAP
jgi:regulatory protein